jgi:hypothetical protein
MTKEEMIQTLALVQGDGCYLDGGEYFDWSTQRVAGDERMYDMEVGDGTDAVRFEMNRDQMVALHAALTATLLAMDEVHRAFYVDAAHRDGDHASCTHA